jgi:hypothetical protein
MRMMLLTKLKALGAAALTAAALCGGLGLGLAPARADDDPAAADPSPRSRSGLAQPADRPLDDATFLDRLARDLRGTPATDVERGYFTADPDGDKRQKVVDWFLADDAVKAFLAKKLGVPADRVRLVTVHTAASGSAAVLVALAPAAGGQQPVRYAVTVDPITEVLYSDDLSFAVNSTAGVNGSVVLNEVYDATPRLFTTYRRQAPNRVWVFRDPAGVTSSNYVTRVAIAGQPQTPWVEVIDRNVATELLYFTQDPQPSIVHQPYAEQPLLVTQPDHAVQVWRGTVAFNTLVGDSDADFLRRVVQEARGGPPTAVEEKYFLGDQDPNKREKLLDALLKDPAVAKKLGDDWKKKMLESPPVVQDQPYTLRYTMKPRVLDYDATPYLHLRTARLWTVREAAPAPFARLVEELLGANKTDEQVLDALTLAAAGRLPTAAERALTLAAVSKASDRKAAWLEVARALAATDEARRHAADLNKANPPPEKK